MNKPTFKIDGPAGDKFTCSVPQQFHQIGNGVYDMNMIEACNWLSYFKEYDEYKIKLEEKARGINKL